MNNAPLPVAMCASVPELQKYGFYRRLDTGKFEFKSFCDPDSPEKPGSNHWLAIYDKDMVELLDGTLPDKPGMSLVESVAQQNQVDQ